MANGIRTSDSCGFNKGCSSKFREDSRVRQTPEEGRRTYQPKRYGNNNKDEDNSPKTLNDKNHQASSQKIRRLKNMKTKNVYNVQSNIQVYINVDMLHICIFTNTYIHIYICIFTNTYIYKLINTHAYIYIYIYIYIYKYIYIYLQIYNIFTNTYIYKLKNTHAYIYIYIYIFIHI